MQSASSWSARAVSVWLNQKLVVDHALLENYYDRKTPVPPQRPDSTPDPWRGDPLAQPLHP